MCLAIPGKISSIESRYDGQVNVAKVQFGGITKEVRLDMVPAAKEGDFVLVHVGVAISIVVNDLVVEPIIISVSGVTGSAVPISRTPKPCS